MGDDGVLEANHISVIIPEAPTSHDPQSLERETDRQSEEIASANLDISADNAFTGESEINTRAAVPGNTILYEAPIAGRWYFKTDGAAYDHDNERRFVCSNDYQPPVRVNPYIMFASWHFSNNFAAGLYDIILGLSTNAFNFDLIETLTFRITDERRRSIAPSELIRKQDLKAMCGFAGEPVKWRLYRQLDTFRNCKALMIEMEFRLSAQTFSEIDTGRLDLHFMELHNSQNADFDRDPSILSHRPWMWSLDIHRASETAAPKIIMHCAFSGDASHVATLAVSGNSLFLELWAISSSDGLGANAMADFDADPPSQRPRQQSRLCEMLQMDLQPNRLGLIRYSVTISRDGSQVVLLDSMPPPGTHYENLVAVYRHDHFQHLQTDKTPKLRRSSGYQHCKELSSFIICGKFHVAKASGQMAQDEVFIAYTDGAVYVFSVFRKWRLLRTISTSTFLSTNLYSSGRINAGCVGRFFAWFKDDIISVWDMEQGSPISVKTVKEGGSTRYTDVSHAISDDGSMLAVLRDSVISVNEVASGTEVQSIKLPEHYECHTEVWFIRNDTQLLVQTSRSDAGCNRGHHGLILDAKGLFVVDRILLPGEYIDVVKSPAAADQFYAYHGSRLHRIRLDDCTIYPYSWPYIPSCDETCKDNLIDFDTLPKEYTAKNGLQFRSFFQNVDGKDTMVAMVTSADGSEASRRLVTADHHHFSEAVFLDKLHRLLVVDGESIMVWGLPEAMDGELSLLFFGSKRAQWKVCPHQQLFCRNLDRTSGHLGMCQCLPLEQLDSLEGAQQFLAGFDRLFQLEFKNLDMKESVERYIGRHINRLWISKDGKLDLLSHFHSDLYLFRNQFERVLPVVLRSSLIRWLPRSDMDHSTNPISILLERAEFDPQVMQYVEIIIDYCLRQARADKDLRLLLPVIQCLYKLIDPNRPHADLAARILQQLAYFPVKSRAFLIQHHVTIHPPELRLRFWKHSARPLYQCKESILQMACGPQTRDGLSDYFTRDLFAATFDLLWNVNIDPAMNLTPGSCSASSITFPLSWITGFMHIIRHKCRLTSTTAVKTHRFTLEMLDNPAIAALVEYKWNTIGFKYWMIRFLSQCCFYALVLSVVFKHIYDDGQGAASAVGVIVAILVSSSLFLWLELVQLIRSWDRYLSSAYNAVDLVVFALPFAGSINQLLIMSKVIQGSTANEGNAGIFSFAVIFIFLHFLFELRVNKTVCQFVTVIIRIISQIRIFFFIFTAGIFAFTVATLHILHSCPFEECSDPSTKLPSKFFYALSATYFFMGGRYDAVNGDFDSENWQFHVLMMIYFFFTVILMLNVLIALINVAFSVGDGTWRLVWFLNKLQVIESAENLSYHIPGFRQSSTWFPKEIYYSASKKQVLAFEKAHPIAEGHDAVIRDNSHQSDQEDPLKLLRQQQETLQKEMENMRDQSQEQNGALRKQNDELKKQLSQLQESFAAQKNDMRALITELLASSSS